MWEKVFIIVLCFYSLNLLASVRTQINNGCSYTQLKRDPNDCNKFYQCSNGYEYPFECPATLVFNDKVQVCDWLYNVPECTTPKTTTILTTETTNTPITTTIATSTTEDPKCLFRNSSVFDQGMFKGALLRNCSLMPEEDFYNENKCNKTINNFPIEDISICAYSWPTDNDADFWGFNTGVKFCKDSERNSWNWYRCEFDCGCRILENKVVHYQFQENECKGFPTFPYDVKCRIAPISTSTTTSTTRITTTTSTTTTTPPTTTSSTTTTSTTSTTTSTSTNPRIDPKCLYRNGSHFEQGDFAGTVFRNCTLMSEEEFKDDKKCSGYSEPLIDDISWCRSKWPTENEADCWGYNTGIKFCDSENWSWYQCEFDCGCRIFGNQTVHYQFSNDDNYKICSYGDFDDKCTTGISFSFDTCPGSLVI